MLADYLWPKQVEPALVPAEVFTVEDVLISESSRDTAPPSEEVVGDEPMLNAADEQILLEKPAMVIKTPTHNRSFVEPIPPPAEFMLFLGDFIYADVPVWWGDSEFALICRLLAVFTFCF